MNGMSGDQSSFSDGVIPVVDITALRDGSDTARVARELHAASTGPGFVYVSGHGIPDAVLNGAREAALAFFRKPSEAKTEVAVAGAHRGWIAQGGARMRDDLATDLKESFVWGRESVPGEPSDDHPLRGANRWPTGCPELRAQATAWFERAHEVARHLLHGFALGLDLPKDFFLRRASRPLSRASFVYYPPQAGERFGVAPHTDFGVLTVLAQDAIGGLEVQRPDGAWIAAPPIEGTLVVNVADLLSRWTNGIYHSTPHRVVNRSGRERLSLVLAFDPDPDALVDSREVVGEVAGQASPITCGDYLEWRFGKAFAYRNSPNAAGDRESGGERTR